MRKEKKGKEKDYVEIELELPMWMIRKVEEKHIDLSKALTEEIEKLDDGPTDNFLKNQKIGRGF